MKLSSAILLLLCVASRAAAINEQTTIVLHVVDTPFMLCNQATIDGTDCEHQRPQVNAAGMTSPAVLVLLRNYGDAMLLQCAFDVPSSWVYTFGLWDCQGGLHPDMAPAPPFGPVAGTVSYLFGDPITGGYLTPVGRMHFASAPGGCLDIIESAFPHGTHVMSSWFEITPISQENRGRICVGPGGHDACDPAATPVDEATWGRIKSQYVVR